MNFYFHQTDEPRPSPPEILLEIKLIGKFRNREKSDSRRNRVKSLDTHWAEKPILKSLLNFSRFSETF